MASSLSLSATPRTVPYFALDVSTAFASLSTKEKLYSHHFNAAAWYGSMVCAAQLSVESPRALTLFYSLFAQNSIQALRAFSETAGDVAVDEFDRFLEYVALFYSNMGNYLSFGDSKFVPSCTKKSLLSILRSAPCSATQGLSPTEVEALVEQLYDASAGRTELGFAPRGTTAYYGPDVTEANVEAVDAVLAANNISPLNTRVFRAADGTFEVHVASARQAVRDLPSSGSEKVRLVYGDFHRAMSMVVYHLRLALPHVANDTQRSMLEAYVRHFESGHIDEHKESQRHWVRDQGPVVEVQIGFIESYRDPRGVRAEWEGFVAVVNKAQSLAYQHLVDGAPAFLSQLPWGKTFETDVFTKPDFTALEVLGFASSGLPSGINIPNYDDIRREIGFKNVYLANVVAAMSFKEKMSCVTDADWEAFKSHFMTAMQVGVGIHELLGHGSGKLFVKKADGTSNFDAATLNPLTGAPITSWYHEGETWSTRFLDLSNPMEECRAEAVALYLCVLPDILRIFGQQSVEDQNRTVHVVWLQMVRAGLIGLEFYSPDTKQWRQAHMRARFCILQTLLRAPNSIVRITHRPQERFLEITIDESRVRTDGHRAIGELLMHLNVNKAIGDAAAGRAYFEPLTAVDDEFLSIRETVMALRKPRRQFVQPHTRLSTATGAVELLTFDSSVAGAIEAMVQRHRDVPLLL